jgi:sorting nexin-8
VRLPTLLPFVRVLTTTCFRSMWHELRVVLHNRENALLTQAVKLFAKEERDFSEAVLANWTGLVEEVEAMPFE